MDTYTIYFEIFNKKMKYTIVAKNENDAIIKLKDKINIHKIIKQKNMFDEYDFPDFFKNIFGV